MKQPIKINLCVAPLTLLVVFPARALAQHFSDWSPPVNLGPTVNTPDFEVCPSITKSSLSLVPTAPTASAVWTSMFHSVRAAMIRGDLRKTLGPPSIPLLLTTARS